MVSDTITAASLGSADFRGDHGVRYAYVAGAMYKGIASEDLVARMGRAGLLAFLGTGGLRLEEIERTIRSLDTRLGGGRPWGINLLSNPLRPDLEEETARLYLRLGVRRVEAAAYLQMTPALVLYRLNGLTRDRDGAVRAPNRVLAKVSREEVAEAFLSPAPERLVSRLAEQGWITLQEAELARHVPMADDLCVESDSAGHTDQGVPFVLIPHMIGLRDRMAALHGYRQRVRVGAAGGIGTPHAVAAAFVQGADFVLTGSINQCTVEANTSDAVKTLLATANVQDTALAPAGDLFEMGAKVQVFKKGLFFAARGNKLYDLYRQHSSLEEIDLETRRHLEERYFGRSFEAVWEETRQHYLSSVPEVVERAERNPREKMALVFRWYFVHTTRLALDGREDERVNYQIHCGPALGAFNQWAQGTSLEDWRNRHADTLAEALMQGAAELLSRQAAGLYAPAAAPAPGLTSTTSGR